MEDGSVVIENDLLKITVSPIGARIGSLVYKPNGRENVKMLPYVGGLNEVRFGAVLNLNERRDRYQLSVRDAPEGGKRVVAVAKAVPTEDKPFAATVTKTYSLLDGSTCVREALEIANEGERQIALIPWVRNLLLRGTKEQPEETLMMEHGAYISGKPIPGFPDLSLRTDWHLFPAANWTARVALPAEDGSNLFATILKPDDMLKTYNWHRGREDFSTQEFIAAPNFVPPGGRTRWEYFQIVTEPARNVVYASPDLVIGADPHPTGIPADAREVTLAFASTRELRDLDVKGRLTSTNAPDRLLKEYRFNIQRIAPGEIVRRTLPVELQQGKNFHVTLGFARNGRPYFPGALADERGEVVIPLVVGTRQTAEVVYPDRTRGQARLLRIEPRKHKARLAYSCDAFDAYDFPTGLRCFKEDTFEAAGAGPSRLRACAGEFESLQVVLVPKGNGHNPFSVAASDLEAPGGRVPCKSVNEFIYVPTHMPSGYNALNRLGEYPEALLPTKGVDLGQRRNLPLFVTYRVPRDAKPGLYRGSVRLAARGETHDIPVEMTVWNVRLPLRSPWFDAPTSLKGTATGGITVRDAEGKPLDRRELLEAIIDMHLRYRLTACDSGLANALLALKFEAFEKEMEDFVSRGATKIYLGSIPKILQRHGDNLPKVERYLNAKGWTDYFYVRPGFDEASPDLVPQMKAVCEKWKQVSRIPIMETYYHDEKAEALFGLLDIWSRSVSDNPWIRERMAAGDRFWKVNAFPNHLETVPWTIRRSYVDFWDHRFTGTYIWTVKQWHRVTKWGEDYWCDGGVGNLAATLMWPHETGILSTIRLENLRDAIEDNALLWMLREKVESFEGKALTRPAQAKAIERARALLATAPLGEKIETVEDMDRLRIRAGEALSTLNATP